MRRDGVCPGRQQPSVSPELASEGRGDKIRSCAGCEAQDHFRGFGLSDGKDVIADRRGKEEGETGRSMFHHLGS